MLGLLRRNRHDRQGFVLYGAAVAAARDPAYYLPPPAGLGVADTLDGRFDLVGLHAFLLIRHLRAAGRHELAQAVFDAMFSDMDRNLREMGVGDLSVSKRVRAMWEAFHGRAAAYAAALDDGAPGASDPLAAALARNVWRDAPPPDGAPGRLAALVRAQDGALAEQDLAGTVRFLPAAA